MVVVVDVVVWGCFVALGPGWRAIIDGTMEFCSLPENSGQPSVYSLKLELIWVIQQNNDLKQVYL